MSVKALSSSTEILTPKAELKTPELDQQAEKADLIRQQHFLRPGDHIVFCGSCQDWKSVFLVDRINYYKKYHNSEATHYIECPTCGKYIHSIQESMFNRDIDFKAELISFAEKKCILIKK